MTDFKLRPVHIASRALPPSSSPPYANPPQRGNHSKVSNYILFFVLTVLFQIARAHGTAHCRGAHNTKPHPTANGGTTTTTTKEEVPDERRGRRRSRAQGTPPTPFLPLPLTIPHRRTRTRNRHPIGERRPVPARPQRMLGTCKRYVFLLTHLIFLLADSRTTTTTDACQLLTRHFRPTWTCTGASPTSVGDAQKVNLF